MLEAEDAPPPRRGKATTMTTTKCRTWPAPLRAAAAAAAAALRQRRRRCFAQRRRRRFAQRRRPEPGPQIPDASRAVVDGAQIRVDHGVPMGREYDRELMLQFNDMLDPETNEHPVRYEGFEMRSVAERARVRHLEENKATPETINVTVAQEAMNINAWLRLLAQDYVRADIRDRDDENSDQFRHRRHLAAWRTRQAGEAWYLARPLQDAYGQAEGGWEWGDIDNAPVNPSGAEQQRINQARGRTRRRRWPLRPATTRSSRASLPGSPCIASKW